jgi:hypothetical protein
MTRPRQSQAREGLDQARNGPAASQHTDSLACRHDAELLHHVVPQEIREQDQEVGSPPGFGQSALVGGIPAGNVRDYRNSMLR